MAYPADSETVRYKTTKIVRTTAGDNEHIVREESDVPCPTCGTLCDVKTTTIIKGKEGSATAEYTPVANTNT